MNRLKNGIAATLLLLPLFSCASYNAYQKAQGAEKQKDWDNAVAQYEKALEIDPDNIRFRIARDRAKLESSRIHFEKIEVAIWRQQKLDRSGVLVTSRLSGAHGDFAHALAQCHVHGWRR